jgi:hypothetical protein
MMGIPPPINNPNYDCIAISLTNSNGQSLIMRVARVSIAAISIGGETSTVFGTIPLLFALGLDPNG